MIRVIESDPKEYLEFELKELTEDNYDINRNAFIGQCGDGPIDKLYIVAFDCIILAEDSYHNWSGECKVRVLKFVTIDITINK